MLRFIFVLCLFTLAAHAKETEHFCAKYLTANLTRKLQPFMGEDYRVTATDQVFEIDSTVSSGFTAGGRLDSQGVLELVIYTRGDIGRERLPELRGRQAFDLIAEYFKGRIRAIRGRWTHGDNLKTFNRETSDGGIPLEDAAARTWTGRQALRHGFSRIYIESLRGTRGKFKGVEALFVAPQR
jgi:hypothetical protein